MHAHISANNKTVENVVIASAYGDSLQLSPTDLDGAVSRQSECYHLQGVSSLTIVSCFRCSVACIIGTCVSGQLRLAYELRRSTGRIFSGGTHHHVRGTEETLFYPSQPSRSRYYHNTTLYWCDRVVSVCSCLTFDKCRKLTRRVQLHIVRLQNAIRQLNGCETKYIESLTVSESFLSFQKNTLWQVEVAVFEIYNHPQAKRAYAWSYTVDNKDTTYVVVLEIPPVNSPQTAVQAAIAAQILNGTFR